MKAGEGTGWEAEGKTEDTAATEQAGAPEDGLNVEDAGRGSPWLASPNPMAVAGAKDCPCMRRTS